MIPELANYKIGENIYQGTRTLVYRGVRCSDSLKVVIKFLRNSYPSFNELVQFRNQYAIAKNLDSAGILQPLSLERYGNGYALVMEDLGAISLDKLLTTDELDLERCLDIAIQLAEILQELDRQRVIHKDIKPGNILICPETQQVKLIDFSIASLLPREAQEIKNFNVLEGTLAYISPEQTGRMNRGIDYRSDFYSLGATLYQLLTGVLPFSSTDPVELVHCHISQQPVPPAARNPVSQRNRVSGIPPVVSDIVMKLMAKNAEERYQSALGLKFDLETCLKKWKETGKIEPFELATRDISGRFLIPEKLYGRAIEVETLLAAFERVANPNAELFLSTGRQDRVEMMLVAGFSGIGKTAVINEVHKPIVRQRGYFIKGKFDQFNRNIPFSAFTIAFRDLMKQLLAESDSKLAQWQQKILSALSENCQVIIDIIPELELLIGKQPPVPELSGSAAQNRFNLLFEKFIKVFATKEHPLVIFIDDLQWADSASLKLIQLLMGESETGYLLLLGAYRDNEVYPAHPLMLTLDEISNSGATINTITLAPLSATDINDLVADTLNCSQELAWPLTELIYQKTKGNPFFATQFLKALNEGEWISYNSDFGYWQCDMASVRQLTLTDDVVEFMAIQLQKLPQETQEVLKLAACIGNQFDLETLAIVSERSPIETATALWKALQERLVLPTNEVYKFYCFQENTTSLSGFEEQSPTYKFLHDRVQQAAYSLIPENKQKETRLKIGYLLLNYADAEKLSEQTFEIVDHFNFAIELIVDPLEQKKVVQLNLQAGKRAIAATAYQAANKYLTVALSLITDDNWTTSYDLTLDLHIEAANSAYLQGDYEKMETLIEAAIGNAHSIRDRVQAYEIKIQSSMAQNKRLEAIDIALDFLDELGVKISKNPNESDIRNSLEETKNILGETQVKDLVDLPKMIDPEKLAALRILAAIFPAAHQAFPQLLPITVCEQIKLSIQYGNSPISPFSYVLYGLILCATVGDIELGYQFGELALSCLHGDDVKPIKSRTIQVACVLTKHWKEHLKETLDLLELAYQAGLEVGDLDFIVTSAFGYCFNSFFMGRELKSLEQKMRFYSEAILRLKHKTVFHHNEMYRQVVLNLLGQNKETVMLVGEAYNEQEFVELYKEANDRNALGYLCSNKLFLCYLFGYHTQAFEIAGEVREKYIDGLTGLPMTPFFYFYDSLAQIAVYFDISKSGQEKVIEHVSENQEKMKKWAYHAPMNHQHKLNLVSAEKCRVLGQKLEAIELYDRAIAGAKENEYIQEEALANELAAKFYLDWGFDSAQPNGKEKIARVYMTDAYYCYARWGAKAKTNQLEAKYPQLLAPILQQPPLQLHGSETATYTLTQTVGSSSSKIGSMLDWATAMKASQSLSSEIHLDKLVAALMKAAIENAGADGAILLLKQQETWKIVARCSGEGCDLCATEASDESKIPMSVINKVKRSKEAIIINDFPRDTQFAGDPYLLQGQTLSFLCVPVLNQGKLVGVLYLENYLAVGAFTSDRVELLSMLCSQAAISLENARLYQQAQQALTDLQKAQLQLVQSEKMSALGNLVAGVAHEINNPVGFIAGNLDPAQDYLKDLFGLINLYQEKYPEPDAEIEEEIEAIDLEFLRDDLPQLISSMREGTDRIRHISTSLRTFSRTDKEYKVPFNVHEGLDSTLLILKHRLKANEERPDIEIIKEYGQLPEVQCFPGQLNQVFMNLIANAIDALDEGNNGRSFDEIAARPNQIEIRTFIEHQQVKICIRDNGMGMPEEVQERIFEQGFTTKGVGKGTGLGMAIAQQIIVDKHGGRITCSSEPGRGTELAIAIPTESN
ncbi:trifunctional serine/threonine-protein kinase/ATP-binding protein/sensor histidine kinase [Roseofilum casamattae]|uniref:histidine kinase n=1 Tax=Roseofilum casamattae BLCC-M143 TaxID=3022442 RepID=A0ABT7BTR4_9CYAN|nr:AAA family ATPase [Roseofilum casamattae BLCC-M143]